MGMKPEQNRNLSLLSLECILPHLDANKRILLSLRQKQFAKFEKSVDLYIDELVITSSYVIINGVKYNFGEIHDIDYTSPVDEKLKNVKSEVEKRNSEGGFGWTKDGVSEKGVVNLGHRDFPLSEHQKFEKMHEIRDVFMDELEKYLNFEIACNPMNEFQQIVNQDQGDWAFQLSLLILRIRVTSVYGKNDFLDHPLFGDAKPEPSIPDGLTYLYPYAFHKIVDRIKELDAIGDCRASFLRKLAYAPVVFPHFNQFSVFEQPGISEYRNRIPDELTLHDALKKFISEILSGRKNIRVGTFQNDGNGTLPDGLEFDCIAVNLIGSGCATIKSVVRKTNEIFCDFDDVASEFPLIQKCKILQLFDRSLMIDDCFQILKEWARTPNRKVGSRLFLTLNDGFSLREIQNAFNSPTFLRMEFIRNNGEQSYYRPLDRIGTKYVKLSLKNDKTRFSKNFLQATSFNYYFDLQILDRAPALY